MKHEYHDGPEAKKKFEEMAKAMFRAPKTIVKPAVKTVRTPKKTSKG